MGAGLLLAEGWSGVGGFLDPPAECRKSKQGQWQRGCDEERAREWEREGEGETIRFDPVTAASYVVDLWQ
jgi:hypothetical protein